MDSSYFIYTTKGQNLVLERFHICTWEFSDNTSLIEFGGEITSSNIEGKDGIELIVFVPWLNQNSVIEDFYPKLKDPSNSRFIFNDSILMVESLDGGQNVNGVIHKFTEREKLCILPIDCSKTNDQRKIKIRIDLRLYNQFPNPVDAPKANVYFRFCISQKNAQIFETKKGITKSTILYDIRLNQRRNIPDNLLNEILQSELCKVNQCFCFNIIPNTHDLVFFDSGVLKNVRTLEFDSFNRYLGGKALKEKDLIVVFNKERKLDSYAFFSIYSKEHIGMDQLAVALLINLVAGILLFIASVDTSLAESNKSLSRKQLPLTFWLVVLLFAVMLIYFLKRRGNFNSRKAVEK